MSFNFNYYSPTKVIFGRGTQHQAGELVKAQGAKKVLIHYGGGSAKRSTKWQFPAQRPAAAAKVLQKC